MRRTLTSLLLTAFILWPAASARPYTYQYTTASVQIKWPVNTITVALSSSLSSPPANIKAGSDVIGAVRRAMRRWSDATNIQFVETSTDVQAVSPSGAGDGLNVITVSPINGDIFSGERAGRTRVFFNSTGAISEADIALNPNLPFSTDGTPDTYDLEATLTHEFGHFLGLDHSGVVGATMQPRQGRNYSDRFTTMRTLSDDDLAGIRSLYGQRASVAVGTLAGRVNYGAGAHVWAENAATGKVVGSSITKSDGSYSISQLPPGQYRVAVEDLNEPVAAAEITAASGPYTGIGGQAPFLTAEGSASVTAGQTTALDFTVSFSSPSFNPRMFGVNGLLTTVAAPLSAGKAYRLYVGGEGLDQVPASGFTITSPFMSIDPNSYARENFGTPYPVVSFDLKVNDTAKYGDYSIRVQASNGEINYIAGGLALDPYTDYVEPNPLDSNNGFFVRQQYLDFLFREPEPDGYSAWLNVLNRCVNNAPDCDRIIVSQSFFQSQEFQLKGFFVYRFYKVSLGRSPRYAEIIPDMQFVTGATAAEVNLKRDAYTDAFVNRADFKALYAATLSNADYVDALIRAAGVTLSNRDQLISDLNSGTKTRAQVLRAVVESTEVFNKEYNPAFVAMQYFGYLKRDPEQTGYDAWLNYLNSHPGDFRTMVNGFASSIEYRSRFGQS